MESSKSIIVQPILLCYQRYSKLSLSRSHCPITCNSLEQCTNDTVKRIQLPDNRFPLRTCRWASEKCMKGAHYVPGVRHSCRESCS
jgi:hypothetical protein